MTQPKTKTAAKQSAQETFEPEAKLSIRKDKEHVTISYQGRQIEFHNVPQINRKKNTIIADSLSRDELLFLELNRLWRHFSDEELEEVWSLYSEVEMLETEPEELRLEHAPRIMKRLAELHSPARFAQLYPYGSVWIPDLKESYSDIDSNHTEEMTYIKSDYYELLTFTLSLKALIPVFTILNSYNSRKNQSPDEKRKLVDCTNVSYELLMATGLGKHKAVEKLAEYLPKTIENIQKDKGLRTSGGAKSLTLIAAIAGYGMDALEDYIMAYTMVNILALQPVGADFIEGVQKENSIVTRIFYGISPEITEGFADKMSPVTISEKPHASTIKINGEKGKMSVIDVVTGRTPAPIKEGVRTEVFFEDYRKVIKHVGLDIPPATAKMFIDAIIENHTGPFSELHEWIIAAALHIRAHRKTYKDIRPVAFMHGMGIAQAILCNYGFFHVAQLLSCEAIPVEDSNIIYSFDPISRELKEQSNIYYPQAYASKKNALSDVNHPLVGSILRVTDMLITPYEFHLKTTPEVAQILGVAPEVIQFRPGIRLQEELAEFCILQARAKLRFNQNSEF